MKAKKQAEPEEAQFLKTLKNEFDRLADPNVHKKSPSLLKIYKALKFFVHQRKFVRFSSLKSLDILAVLGLESSQQFIAKRLQMFQDVLLGLLALPSSQEPFDDLQDEPDSESQAPAKLLTKSLKLHFNSVAAASSFTGPNSELASHFLVPKITEFFVQSPCSVSSAAFLQRDDLALAMMVHLKRNQVLLERATDENRKGVLFALANSFSQKRKTISEAPKQGGFQRSFLGKRQTGSQPITKVEKINEEELEKRRIFREISMKILRMIERNEEVLVEVLQVFSSVVLPVIDQPSMLGDFITVAISLSMNRNPFEPNLLKRNRAFSISRRIQTSRFSRCPFWSC